MQIEVRQWDGGAMEDLKTGKPINVSSLEIMGLLRGRTVTGVGGVSAGTESIVINLSGYNVWFVTTLGVPRIILQKYDK
jgi:hypothetical protein